MLLGKKNKIKMNESKQLKRQWKNVPHVDRQEVRPNPINAPRLFPLLQHEWNLVTSALTTRQSNECFGPAPT